MSARLYADACTAAACAYAACRASEAHALRISIPAAPWAAFTKALGIATDMGAERGIDMPAVMAEVHTRYLEVTTRTERAEWGPID